jgi:hypothetical protein
MKGKKVVLGFFAINFASLSMPVYGAVVKIDYDYQKNHTFLETKVLNQVRKFPDFPKKGDLGYIETTYTMLSDTQISKNSITYDDSKYYISYTDWKTNDQKMVTWIQKDSQSYTWNGSSWDKSNVQALASNQYNSFNQTRSASLVAIAAPEPSVVMLMGIGAIGIGYAKRRKAQYVA